VKGRVSKWLRNELELEQTSDLLNRGYFACTIGKSKREEVEQYLDLQGTHHGYEGLALFQCVISHNFTVSINGN
jgi:REP element-mobilizing transposase RayT